MIKKDIGICIRKVDYSDTSQILTFFCMENGKVSGIAKGAKRSKSKFGGAMEVLSYGELIFSVGGGDLAAIREFEPRPRFIGIRKSLTAMNFGLFAAELVNHFTEESQQSHEIFNLLCQKLDNIQTPCDNRKILEQLINFQISLLDLSGIGMILDRCSNCGNSKYLGPYLSAEANGLVCDDCQMSFIDKVRLSKPAINTITAHKQISNADFNVLCEIEKALVHYLTQTMHKPPKMAAYFTKMQEMEK